MNSETASVRTLSRSVTRRLRVLGLDPWLLTLTASLLVFGLVMVYSASWDVSWRLSGDPSALFRRQVLHVGLGLVAMFIASRIPITWLRWLWIPIIVVAMLGLIAVLIIGGSGPRRSFWSGSVQPSELAKLALVIYLAVWMESKGERLTEWGYGFLPLMMIIGVVSGLILLQPDLSAGLTVGIVALAMFVMAGAKLLQSFLITLGSGAVGYLLVRVSTTGRHRWEEYVAGLVDVEEASYHVQQSLEGFFGGGLFGRGLGASRGKFGFLPAPHTDSIYAVVGEELGLIGALTVLVLFILLLWRGFRIAKESPHRLGLLLASGITFWIGVEALVNMSVMLGMLPFAGNALPLFSYGGSSLLTTLTGIGLLLGVSRRSVVQRPKGGEVAAVGVSGRDRRRRVSRLVSGRRAGRRA